MKDDEFDRPNVTVDVVLLTIVDDRLMVALAPRDKAPFKGVPAIIGGYVHTEPGGDRDTDDTAHRVLREKVGLDGIFVEQLFTFAGPDRDPRGWSVSIAYFALVPLFRLSDSLGRLTLVPADSPGDLPFDHGRIVRTALDRVRGKGAYSVLPARLLPPSFTMGELQRTYEVVMGQRLDQSSFRRKMRELDLLEEEEAPRASTAEARRPARAYRLKADAGVFDRRI